MDKDIRFLIIVVHGSIFERICDNAKIKNVLFKNVNISAKGEACLIANNTSTYRNANIEISKVGITGTFNAYDGKSWGGAAGFIYGIECAGGSIANVTFTDCYVRANFTVTNRDYDIYPLAGVYPGQGTGKAERCYWSGTNNVKGRTGAFLVDSSINNNDSQHTSSVISVKNCYYDKQKFPLQINHSNNGTGLTTAQMQIQESYVGWDFENTWYMGEDGYPELKFEQK